jgi:hypothetical protein
MLDFLTLTAKGARSVSGSSTLISNASTSFTITGIESQAAGVASQLIQCGNASTTTSIYQVVRGEPSYFETSLTYPSGYSCWLRTFDSTLTQVYINYYYEPRTALPVQTSITQATTSVTVQFDSSTLPSVYMGYTYGDIVSSVFIFLGMLGFFYFAFWAIIKGVKVRN